MESFFARFTCFLLVIVFVKENAAVYYQQSYVLYNKKLKKCPRAVAPNKVRILRCSGYDKLHRWIWTKDGQLQNIATGLCADVDALAVNEDMYIKLSMCNFRKSFQKWRCDINPKGWKLFYVNSAHTEQYLRWRFVANGDSLLSTSYSFSKFNEVHFSNANLCDFNHRDTCLQTIGKIPMDDKCLVFMTTKTSRSHIELVVPSKATLRQFTISIWIKVPANGQGAVFSYMVNGQMVLGLLMKPSKQRSDFFLAGRNLKLASPALALMSGFWTHLAFTWIASTGDFIYYVNGNVIFTQLRQKVKPFSGSGTLWLGRLTRADDLWLSGYVTQLNIFSRAFTANEVAIIARKLHCCNNLPHGDWLSWRNVTDAGKKFGDVRENSGAECTSFEVLSSKWLTEEKIRWNCLASLSVTDPRFISDHHFTASSSTTTEVPWNGRASKKSRTPWCPGKKDHNSYLQVDLGAVRNVTAIGTGMLAKFKARYAKRIKIYSSRRGNIWKNDGKIYEASTKLNPPVKIIPLSSPVLARYLRFYPTSCVPPKCCLSVEIFGCDVELEKRIFESEDGCSSKNKPFILMDLGEMHHVRRIQIKAQSQNHRKSVQGFYLRYISWNQWTPYQIDGKTKVFKGTGETTRSFVHILEIPFLARFIKIYPVPYAQPVCGEFEFIGCLPPRADVCTKESLLKSKTCTKVELPQCKLGFIGDGSACIDVNECEANGEYCSRNSVCKNRIGFYECEPCKNQFIGDGKICQTSCEALGVVCGVNSFCDLSECKCHEGYYNNGTQCVEEDESEGEEATEEALTKERLDGSCPDGFFNCFGDVIGALAKIRKTTLAHSNFHHDECNVTKLIEN